MTLEILEKYIKYRGLILYRQGATSTQVFMPFMCMDAAYQVFSKSFKAKDYQHEQKKWLKFIESKFRHFFTDFNYPFNEDELDIISSDQDKFAEFCGNELMFLKLAIMDGCSGLPLNQQKVISDVYLINNLAQAAGAFYEDAFHSRNQYKGDQHPDIEGVKCGTKSFARAYLREDWEISGKDLERLEKAQTALSRKMIDFMQKHQRVNYEDFNEED